MRIAASKRNQSFWLIYGFPLLLREMFVECSFKMVETWWWSPVDWFTIHQVICRPNQTKIYIFSHSFCVYGTYPWALKNVEFMSRTRQTDNLLIRMGSISPSPPPLPIAMVSMRNQKPSTTFGFQQLNNETVENVFILLADYDVKKYQQQQQEQRVRKSKSLEGIEWKKKK